LFLLSIFFIEKTASLFPPSVFSRWPWASYGLDLAAVVLASIIATLMWDRRDWSDFGFHVGRRWWSDFAFGVALGAFLMSGIFATEWSLGWVTVTAVFHTPYADKPFLLAILSPFLTFVAVGINEELFSRGYLLRNLAEGLNLGVLGPRGALVLAWILTSTIFGLLHLGNPHMTTWSTVNLVVAGFFLGLGYVLTGELAIPIGLHIAWNFFQGNVYGFPVSGTTSFRTLTVLAIRQGGPPLWTGGAFGPEGGLISFVAMGVGTLLLLAWIRHAHGRPALMAELASYRPQERS